jgi:acyl-CoA reductase-like NAD-dependent aldehyde dehydrogenase
MIVQQAEMLSADEVTRVHEASLEILEHTGRHRRAIPEVDAAALAIGDELATGTVLMNRRDYLDPALAWTGVKDSGRGCTLSWMGYEALTRPKSFHLRTAL